MNNHSVPRTPTECRGRAATAIIATNPALIAYVVFMICLTLTVVL